MRAEKKVNSMKRKLLVKSVAAAYCWMVLIAGFICLSAEAYVTAITDTTGYVVLSASDNPGISSLINGNNFPGGAPVAGKDYLVNSTRTIRTPESGHPFTFKGDSLTLDGGASLALKCPGSTTTISDLRIYNARVGQADGNCYKTLAGNLTVFGTPSAPSLLEGSGDNGNRILDITAKINGASGTCLQVAHTAAADKNGCEFIVRPRSNNSSTFMGTFEVVGNNVNAAVPDMSYFGSSCSVTLRNGGGLLGYGSTGMTVNGKTVTVENGGRMGSFDKNGTAITFTGGSTISGTGTLLIRNSTVGGTWKGPIAMNDVTVSGLDGIVVTNNAALAVGGGYRGAAIPIAVRSGGTLRGDGAGQTGAVTLEDGATLAFTPSSGALVINGALATTAADGKIHVDIASQDVTTLAATNAYRLMTATNLGAAGATLSVSTRCRGRSCTFREPMPGEPAPEDLPSRRRGAGVTKRFRTPTQIISSSTDRRSARWTDLRRPSTAIRCLSCPAARSSPRVRR